MGTACLQGARMLTSAAIVETRRNPESSGICEELAPPHTLEVRHLTIDGINMAVLSFALPSLCFPPELTPAEREIATMLCEGRPLKAIAKLRRRSRCTILNQARSIYAKLGVHSRAEMVHRLVEG